ncbi:BTB/POZ domain-containing protein [Acorus gramineus]|uniref:BTB/POZ domain-containing protein n=1 Tax=Acorus gramineus TaxID=55184 RepID=A0AAV9B4G8_ACOGR|nr:BTB/POZ domain-containing protein [Acorus gramineus]
MFPLLAKCGRLQRLFSNDPSMDSIDLPDFPGGAEAFETCAKFCYGISITLSAFNLVSVRCACAHLDMSERVERGNLSLKLDSFFSSCVLRGWKDSLVALRSTKAYAPQCEEEELGITPRCVDAIASKVAADPSRAGWGDDLAELGIDHYWRVMLVVRSVGTVPPGLVGDTLRAYAARWLPHARRDESRHRAVLERIVNLLPAEKGAVGCGFLSMLLKASNVLGASEATKGELVRRVGVQLEQATVEDLMISLDDGSGYDVNVVASMLDHFMTRGEKRSPPTSPPRRRPGPERRRRSRSAEDVEFGYQESRRSSAASHGAKLLVGKVIDGYLKEVAGEPNLPVSKFVALAEAVPDFARTDHDDLYKAIDTYLRAHQNLGKEERKRLCRGLDCKKLSVEACMHAAQNELLPLRVVVQLLYFDQARSATAAAAAATTPNIKALLASKSVRGGDGWSVSGLRPSGSKSSAATLRMKLAEGDDDDSDSGDDEASVQRRLAVASKLKGLCAIPARPKRMFIIDLQLEIMVQNCSE